MKHKIIYIFTAISLLLSCTQNDLDTIILGEEQLPFHGNPVMNIAAVFPRLQSHQSMAIYEKYIIFMHSDKELYGSLYDITTKEYICNLEFPIGGYKLPHANVACFGPCFLSADSQIPLLYVSQWNYEGERGVLVYDISMKNDGQFDVKLIQTIIPNISPKILGAGCVDWIVDTDSNYLYALAYKLAGASTIEEGNAELIVKFKLPSISDGSKIILTDSDVIDHYSCETFNYSQDKCYHDGHIYIAAGGSQERYSHMNKLIDLDLNKKEVTSVVSLLPFGLREPEGLAMYNGDIVMTYFGNKSNEMYRIRFYK